MVIPACEENRHAPTAFRTADRHRHWRLNGIGLATAREIARLGGSLCLIVRRAEPLARAQQRIRAEMASSDQFVETLKSKRTKSQNHNMLPRVISRERSDREIPLRLQ